MFSEGVFVSMFKRGHKIQLIALSHYVCSASELFTEKKKKFPSNLFAKVFSAVILDLATLKVVALFLAIILPVSSISLMII